ncbi:hypothetical protein ACIBG7_14355 [Nonomuraea sp. NPDC050328]|uniref:hypothetical protein n=1 Tax=Nonomuraea sp. NPDC050328 TaxID=3364361 RepID=UPI003793D010
MDLTPYVDTIRREIALAAEAGGEEARALAVRLSATVESAARLALLEALSAAADEITRDLAPGSVDVRLRGRDPQFVVTPSPPTAGTTRHHEAPADEAPVPEAEDGAVVRVALRVPEQLKPRIDEAAGREGLSVNSWLVRVVASALDQRTRRRTATPDSGATGQRFTGWVS